MKLNMTEPTKNYYINVLADDAAVILNDIKNTPEQTTAELWKEKFKRISAAYSMSSRLALIRLLDAYQAAWDKGEGTNQIPAPEQQEGAGEQRSFEDVVEEAVKGMSAADEEKYLRMMKKRALFQPYSNPDRDNKLIELAWKGKLPHNPQPGEEEPVSEEQFTRSDALLLGHILDFSYEAMQWYLLRVFQDGGMLKFNRAEDLIEGFCFQTGASWKFAQELKEEYRALGLEAGMTDVNVPYNSIDGTEQIQFELEETTWNQTWQDERERKKQFLDWLTDVTPRLNAQSRTACMVYRNLAAFAQDLLLKKVSADEAKKRLRKLPTETRETEEAMDALFFRGRLSKTDCEEVADQLVKENIQLAQDTGSITDAWWTITAVNGKLPNKKEVKERITKLLMGEIQVQKSDLLSLYWFVSNLIWNKSDLLSGSGDIKERLEEFISGADKYLTYSLLPGFYVPHILEQSMLLAIAASGRDEKIEEENEDGRVKGEDKDGFIGKKSSAFLYGLFLKSVNGRNRDSGSESHSIAFQYEALKGAETKRWDFEERYGFSRKTVSGWKKLEKYERILEEYSVFAENTLQDYAGSIGMEEAYGTWKKNILKVLEVVNYTQLHRDKKNEIRWSTLLARSMKEYGIGQHERIERQEDLLNAIKTVMLRKEKKTWSLEKCAEKCGFPENRSPWQQNLLKAIEIYDKSQENPTWTMAECAGKCGCTENWCKQQSELLTMIEVAIYYRENLKRLTRRYLEECAQILGVGRKRPENCGDFDIVMRIIHHLHYFHSPDLNACLKECNINIEELYESKRQKDFLEVLEVMYYHKQQGGTLEECAKKCAVNLTPGKRAVIETAEYHRENPRYSIIKCARDKGYHYADLFENQKEMLDMIQVAELYCAKPEPDDAYGTRFEKCLKDYGYGEKITQLEEDLLNAIEIGMRYTCAPELGLDRCAVMGGFGRKELPKQQADLLKLLRLMIDFRENKTVNMDKKILAYEIDEASLCTWEKDVLAMMRIAAYRRCHNGSVEQAAPVCGLPNPTGQQRDFMKMTDIAASLNSEGASGSSPKEEVARRERFSEEKKEQWVALNDRQKKLLELMELLYSEAFWNSVSLKKFAGERGVTAHTDLKNMSELMKVLREKN